MSKYITVPTSVEVGLEEFDDDAVVQYLEESGYTVSYKDTHLEKASWYISRGDLESAVLEIERNIPELKGLSDLIKKNSA